MTAKTTEIHRQCANALRFLAIDAVQAANSGHPGMPMGMADIAEVLWRKWLKHNPASPHWADRDRFVLSNGHGSMLIYALLHLTGYDLSLADLKAFRQWGSKTAGHPEVHHTPGIETTTGPLGQGIANAVGMALAEKILGETFNRDGHAIVDHHTYVFLGDGCLMEGVSHEACSLAGTLGLGKLIVFYDDNGISIDGHVTPWFSDDTPARFKSYGWQVLPNVDGHDAHAIDTAIRAARAETAKPTLICCKTTIGFGSPNKAGTHDVHGAPLGKDEIAATRAHLGWTHEPFMVPDPVRNAWNARDVGRQAETDWQQRFERYRAAHPELAAEFVRRVTANHGAGVLPRDWEARAKSLIEQTRVAGGSVATRKASQNAIEAIGPVLPEMLGGSADLTGSNLTNWSGTRSANRSPAGNYVNYGVREFGMTAIANGLGLHGGFIPYTATFLVFADYARNAIRMAALMNQRQIMVYTHDSIGLGEDGPTHQPIEHLASLRIIPGVDVWRPADATETAAAWVASIERADGPSVLALSRQNLPAQALTAEQTALIQRGGYILSESAGKSLDCVLIATGSEVQLAISAQAELAKDGIYTRVVSMPCTRRFDRQTSEYQRHVLPAKVPRVAVEAAHPDLWRKYVGVHGAVIGLDHFGASAPAGVLYQQFGITVEAIVAAARKVARRAPAEAIDDTETDFAILSTN